MKLRDFLPILLVTIAFAVFMAAPALAQEEEIITEEEVIEEATPADTVTQEEVVPVEEEVAPVEEEVIEEEVAPIEEEVVEEEVVEEAPVVEVVKEEPSMFKPGWIAKAYINIGVMEPGQAGNKKGTGSVFNTGMRFQGGAQLNIGNWVKLPLIFQPLTAEVMAGIGMWNAQPQYENWYKDGKHQIISILALGRYDFTDLLFKAIGFENPSLGVFGTLGFQYNLHSWDFPNSTREFDPVSSFGIAYGAGVKYNLMNTIGKPVEIDLRVTQGLFLLGDVKDKDGNPFFTVSEYGHLEYGVMLGIAYPF